MQSKKSFPIEYPIFISEVFFQNVAGKDQIFPQIWQISRNSQILPGGASISPKYGKYFEIPKCDQAAGPGTQGDLAPFISQ